ncbi:uncharacterized protein LOC134282309 [Saccostrea cucullata]|uniref:uncharacterized protein LOC134282309 n=1 Tax=Saccostrea cuccullata TaxID=36930 RepID=UPI002ED4D7C2
MDLRTSVQDVMRCDLCETTVVQMHYDACLVNLCTACECDILVCSACIASKNHKDHDVHLLKDIIDKKKAANQTEINELEESIHPTYLNIAEDVQNTLSQEGISEVFGKIIPTSISSDNHGYSIKTVQVTLGAEMSLLLEKRTGSSPPVKKLLDEPKTVTTIDTPWYGNLYSVACLSYEENWTSGDDSTMKLYSINQGSRLKSITTKSGKRPSNIAKSGNLVYTDYYGDRTVHIVKIEKIEEVIRLQNWKPRYVCSTSSDDLLVVMDSDDYNQKYTGYTPAAKNKPFNPRGITTDSQSHILTADIDNHCVLIIDQDGQFLRYIDCGLCSYPQGLCTDTNDNLFVAQNGNRQVKKIKYLK